MFTLYIYWVYMIKANLILIELNNIDKYKHIYFHLGGVCVVVPN